MNGFDTDFLHFVVGPGSIADKADNLLFGSVNLGPTPDFDAAIQASEEACLVRSRIVCIITRPAAVVTTERLLNLALG